MGCMEELSYLWRLPHKGVARRSTVNLFPHWGNGNYGEVWPGVLNPSWYTGPLMAHLARGF